MVDLVNNKIILAGKEHVITAFQVWWLVPPLGLFTTIEEAMEAKSSSGGDSFHAVPVAVTDSGIYEQV